MAGFEVITEVGHFKALQLAKGPNLNHQPIAHIYLWGGVRYSDDVGIIRNIVILRHYKTATGRFEAMDDRDLEYAD